RRECADADAQAAADVRREDGERVDEEDVDERERRQREQRVDGDALLAQHAAKWWRVLLARDAELRTSLGPDATGRVFEPLDELLRFLGGDGARVEAVAHLRVPSVRT